MRSQAYERAYNLENRLMVCSGHCSAVDVYIFGDILRSEGA